MIPAAVVSDREEPDLHLIGGWERLVTDYSFKEKASHDFLSVVLSGMFCYV